MNLDTAKSLAYVCQDRAGFRKTEESGLLWDAGATILRLVDRIETEAHQLVDYVFGRPVGEKSQEVGGVMVTLAALCLAQQVDMHDAVETELSRIWTKVEQIRAKQAAKPKHSPLPEHPSQPIAQPDPDYRSLSVPMGRIAERKLGSLIVDGYSVCGVMIERPNEDATQVKRAAVSVAGLVLWWHPAQPVAYPVAQPEQRLPDVQRYELMRHSANEWADMAINGLQWLRNIVDGTTTDPSKALENMEQCLKHCRDVNDAAVLAAAQYPVEQLEQEPVAARVVRRVIPEGHGTPERITYDVEWVGVDPRKWSGDLYTRPQPKPERVALTDDEIWNNEEIMAANSGYGASFETLREVIRATEAAHNIKGI